MKKSLLIALLLFCGFASLPAQWRLLVRLEAALHLPQGDVFKNVYGKQFVAPEVKLAVRAFSNLGIWLGYGRTQRGGQTLDLGTPAKLQENIYAVGLGYWGELGAKAGFFIEVGYAQVKYTEKILNLSGKGTAKGFIAEAGLVWRLGKVLGLTLKTGYQQAKEKVDGETFDLSRMKAGFGLEARL